MLVGSELAAAELLPILNGYNCKDLSQKLFFWKLDAEVTPVSL